MVRFEDLRIFVSAADHGSFSAAARAGPDAGGRQRRPETAGADAGDAAVRPLHAQPAADGGRRALPGVRPLGHRHAGRRPQRAGARQDRHQRHAVDLGALGPGAQRAVALAGRIPAPPSRVGFQVRISDRLADLFRQPVDLAVRYGTPADSSLVALPSESNRRVVCASPAYLARHGTPQAPPTCAATTACPSCWGVAARPLDLRARRRVPDRAGQGDRVSDDGELVRRWALAGCGVAYKSRYDVLEDLRAGRLVQLFSDHLGEPSPLYLLCVHRMLLSPAVKRLRACRSASPRSRRAERGPPDGAHQARGASDGALPGIRLQAAVWRAWRLAARVRAAFWQRAPAGRAFGSGGFARGGGTVGGAALAAALAWRESAWGDAGGRFLFSAPAAARARLRDFAGRRQLPSGPVRPCA